MTVAVTARGWGWRHATRRAWAVRGVDLAIAPGERVMLLGPSGSGKSTLLAGLAGLLDPETGEQEGELLTPGGRRGRTGLLLQDPLAQTVLARVGDDVAFGLENHAVPPDRIWPRVERALQGVAFPYGTAHPTAQLSGGERQRLALAGVLALEPGLLLLDEPTAMLDEEGAAVLRVQVARVLAATGATCVLVEHRVAPWLDQVDRVVVLDGGTVVADGDPAIVLEQHGARLAAGGVWVPGYLPRARRVVPAAPGEVLLEARALGATRPGRARAGLPPVVSGHEHAVRSGTATCLTGPNGAGKSTLALVLGGLAPPAAGELRASSTLQAAARSPHPHRWRSRELVTRIGTVFQEPQHQFVAGTVADELAVGPRRTGVPDGEVRRRGEELLQRLRLDHLARANPFTLSGGEQRRLSVATALATRPRVLVLDEPTFGQDARTWAELVDLLVALLDGGAAVVAATHDESLVRALAADVVRLERPHAPGAAPAGAVP